MAGLEAHGCDTRALPWRAKQPSGGFPVEPGIKLKPRSLLMRLLSSRDNPGLETRAGLELITLLGMSASELTV